MSSCGVALCRERMALSRIIIGCDGRKVLEIGSGSSSLIRQSPNHVAGRGLPIHSRERPKVNRQAALSFD